LIFGSPLRRRTQNSNCFSPAGRNISKHLNVDYI
jgi:hypothetical protein